MEPLGIVQDAGFSESLALLEIRRPGETSYLGLWSSPRGPRVFRVTREDKRAAFAGKIPGGLTALPLPPGIVGAHIARITPMEIALYVKTENGIFASAITVSKRRISIVRLDALELSEEATLPPTDNAILRDIAASALDAHRENARSVLAKAIARIGRRIEGVERDIVEMNRAESLIAQAQWLVALAAKAKRGATTLAYTEWTEDGPIERALTLDPARAPKAQIDAMFHRARRLKAGRAFANKRKAAAEHARAGMLALRETVTVATALTTIDEILARAKKTWPKEVLLTARTQGPKAGTTGAERVSFKTYLTTRDERILVGRTDRDNDALTFRIARPHDLFLHARGEPGSHVVVPLAKNRSITPELLIDAAHLAAHFSRAKDEDRLEIEYTPKKWVRKHKGSAAGAVWYERVSVLSLVVDRERLRKLLEREDA